MAQILVLGSGIAGLSFALRASAFARVEVVTKKEAAESNTNYAQGGIAAVLGSDDEADLHYRDTMETGSGLSDPAAVRILVTEGPARVRELLDWGAEFARNADGSFELGREGGHSRRRIVHAKDRTGREVERALLAACAARGVRISTFRFAADLLIENDRVAGAALLDPREGMVRVRADAVVLATGGAGRIYPVTTNPAIATGDGVAMAIRAGAVVRDLEFVQFHPTALARPHDAEGSAAFLVSEAVRGEGAVLVNSSGERFMTRYDERGELAPRDVVARAIEAERKRTGADHMLLDARAMGSKFAERFPTIHRVLLAVGVDPLTEPIPVVPAAHYFCGGVRTDAHGRTSLPGLYALGECAAHGIHGGNRLASNSLLEALVFAARAAEGIRGELGDTPREKENWRTERISLPARPVSGLVSAYAEALRDRMGRDAGIVRTDAGLAGAAAQIAEIRGGLRRICGVFAPTRELLESLNMVEVAGAVVRAARSRSESRGLHHSSDHPDADPAQATSREWREDPSPLAPLWGLE